MTDKIDFTIIVVGIAAIVIGFLALVTPFEGTKFSSLWNLGIFGSIAVLVILLSLKKKRVFDDFFSLKDGKEFNSRFAVGVIYGVIGVFATSMLFSGIAYLNQLTTSMSLQELGTVLNSENVLFVDLIQPLSETFWAMSAILFIYVLLKDHLRIKVATMLVAASIVFVMFAWIHFSVQGAAYYEYSPSGFIEFVTDTQGIGTEEYHGGFVFIPYAVWWFGLAIVYKKWVEAFSSHLTHNIIITSLASQLTQDAAQTNFYIAVAVFLFVVFAIYQTKLYTANKIKLANIIDVKDE